MCARSEYIYAPVIQISYLCYCVNCLLYICTYISTYIGRNGTKVQEFLTLMKINRPTHENGLQNNGKRGHDISVFSYTSILAATSNFSDEKKLGEGGFGSVYQVILRPLVLYIYIYSIYLYQELRWRDILWFFNYHSGKIGDRTRNSCEEAFKIFRARNLRV